MTDKFLTQYTGGCFFSLDESCYLHSHFARRGIRSIYNWKVESLTFLKRLIISFKKCTYLFFSNVLKFNWIPQVLCISTTFFTSFQPFFFFLNIFQWISAWNQEKTFEKSDLSYSLKLVDSLRRSFKFVLLYSYSVYHEGISCVCMSTSFKE